MNYKKIIFTTILVTLIAVFSAALGWIVQFFLVAIFYYYGSLYLMSKDNTKNKNRFNLLILVLPFILLYGYVFFVNPSPNLKVLPILVFPVISLFLGYLTFKKGNNSYYLFFYTIIFVFLTVFGMPNWINYISDVENPINKPFPELSIKDINNNSFFFKKDKVIIIDLWSSSCGICIKKFPEYEKLMLKYKEDDRVRFYTLNLPLARDSLIDIKSYVRDYEFNSLFVVDDDSRKKLDNKSVPKLLIVDKLNKIVYKGSLNDKWYEFYNDIDDLIEKHVNE
ncbi:TlpA disulfide reductase family protein [Lacinutrix sp.]|uniref:TlpA family protein disulfide reductase n=1 Tax=Lacinutrix sp. TaxID=1937692 RepID=UPI0025BEB4FF|nr:TlpA disulfide reductase family protein [Lacinutrix sp.]